MCDYGQGDGSRTVSFEYACAPTMSTPTASQPDQSSDPPHYVIKFAGPGGCPGGGGAGGGTSWGTLFLILFPVAVGLCARYAPSVPSRVSYRRRPRP